MRSVDPTPWHAARLWASFFWRASGAVALAVLLPPMLASDSDTALTRGLRGAALFAAFAALTVSALREAMRAPRRSFRVVLLSRDGTIHERPRWRDWLDVTVQIFTVGVASRGIPATILALLAWVFFAEPASSDAATGMQVISAILMVVFAVCFPAGLAASLYGSLWDEEKWRPGSTHPPRIYLVTPAAPRPLAGRMSASPESVGLAVPLAASDAETARSGASDSGPHS